MWMLCKLYLESFVKQVLFHLHVYLKTEETEAWSISDLLTSQFFTAFGKLTVILDPDDFFMSSKLPRNSSFTQQNFHGFIKTFSWREGQKLPETARRNKNVAPIPF